MRKDWADGIESGDRFNAFVKKSDLSKMLCGAEGAGQKVRACPCVALTVTTYAIESFGNIFLREYFKFEKIHNERD